MGGQIADLILHTVKRPILFRIAHIGVDRKNRIPARHADILGMVALIVEEQFTLLSRPPAQPSDGAFILILTVQISYRRTGVIGFAQHARGIEMPAS
ncbi:MAG: hypothetical protein BWY83_02562 [bacterium ADurb.Bin478]|nr:MAG: hypothetical protein BWY83_02562 [bacterium ADurb.Bin478]